MAKSANLKGKIFEWFVKRFLKSCGFRKVQPDNNYVFHGNMGLMVHGLGQPHNTDVLMYPPFQIPYYYPSRLILECKAYDSKVGLPIVRNLLGLREDINRFEILTPSILKERRNPHRRKPATFEYDRYSYQVGLATINEITIPAQEFAISHKIPILSFIRSRRYDFLRNIINKIDDDYCEELGPLYYSLLRYFNGGQKSIQIPKKIDRELFEFIRETKNISTNIFVGILEDGNFIFLYSEREKFQPAGLEIKAEIFFNDETDEWRVDTIEKTNSFFFELPPIIYREF